MTYYLTPIKMAIIKKNTNNICWWGCEEKGIFLHCWWECKLVQSLWRTVWRFLKKLKQNYHQFSSAQFSCSVVSDSLQPHESQHTRPPCPPPAPRVYSNSCPPVGDATQPSHLLSSPSPPAPNPTQHQGLFQWVNSSHEVAKVLKAGKTTGPFRYDLNQIPYDYIVEVRNRFKGLDLTDREPDELWMEVCDIIQETGIKTIPTEKNYHMT